MKIYSQSIHLINIIHTKYNVDELSFIRSLLIPSITLEGLFNGSDLISSLIYLNLAVIIAIIDYNITHIAKISQSIYIHIRCPSS
jgi:hypothetical protein